MFKNNINSSKGVQERYSLGIMTVIWIMAIFFLVFSLGPMTGCASKPEPRPKPFQCQLPTGVNLDQAMAEARSNLSHQKCQYRFDEYFQALLEIGTGDPQAENRKKFSNFLVWANEQGILNRVQAKEYFNRYFNTTFVALPDDYNVCSNCAKQAEIVRSMEKELRMKEKGLLRVCGDKKSYYQANNDFDSVLLVLEATCTACEAR